MSETIDKNETPMKVRLVELYMESCQLVSKMKNQINLKQKAEVRITFQKFRINLTEMFYLARTLDDIKDDEIMKRIKAWTNVNCGSRCSKKFYMTSISLFEDFSELLVSRGGLV